MKLIIELRESAVFELTLEEQESKDFSHIVVCQEMYDSFASAEIGIDTLLDADIMDLSDSISTADSLEEACEIALETSWG